MQRTANSIHSTELKMSIFFSRVETPALAVKVTFGLPFWPLLVVTMMTPFEPREP